MPCGQQDDSYIPEEAGIKEVIKPMLLAVLDAHVMQMSNDAAPLPLQHTEDKT